MHADQRRLLFNALPLLLAIAVLGYLMGGMAARHSAGSGHAQASAAAADGTAERTLPATNIVVLAYTATPGWQPAASAPQIPGLAIAQSLVLAPGGNAASAGLLAGRLVGGGSSPLPPNFLARLPGPPRGEVVNLANTQAYRYPRLSPRGFAGKLTLYAIPNFPGTTLLACYAPATGARTGDLASCEGIVAQLALQAESQSKEPLTPDPSYAQQVRTAVRRVDALRLALRPAMRTGTASATLATLAARLAAGSARAAESLATLQSPPAVRWANAALATALARTHDAYATLAAATGANSAAGYQRASALVEEAESGLDGALGSFMLLGYA